MEKGTAVNNTRSLRECAGVFLKGFLMGTADVIPGISGGTIAFITGIYEELLDGIKSFNAAFLRNLFRNRLRETLSQVAWQFLLSLMTGIFLAIFTLAGLISWLMTNHPVLLNAFFFGLIAGSVWVVARTIKRWSPGIIAGIVLSAAVAYGLFGMVPINTPTHPLFIFFCGVIAICAMILPGISGSFILLILGKYEYIIHAVKDRDVVTLVTFAFGCLVGILSFVRLVSWCLKRYHNQTIAVLTGFVIGALRKIWPWKDTLSTYLDRHGDLVPLEQVNVWPMEINVQTGFALILIMIGVVLALRLSEEPSQSVHE